MDNKKMLPLTRVRQILQMTRALDYNVMKTSEILILIFEIVDPRQLYILLYLNKY